MQLFRDKCLPQVGAIRKLVFYRFFLDNIWVIVYEMQTVEGIFLEIHVNVWVCVSTRELCCMCLICLFILGLQQDKLKIMFCNWNLRSSCILLTLLGWWTNDVDYDDVIVMEMKAFEPPCFEFNYLIIHDLK